MSDSLPKIVRYKPFYFKLVPAKRYWWCACGLSRNQPFCDGSHKQTDFEPVEYRATADDTEALFCACKRTRTPPFCDGSHNNLRDDYDEDDPHSDSNRSIPSAKHHKDGRFELNGDCYVARVGRLPSQRHGNATWRRSIGADTGARFQSQFYIEIAAGRSPAMAFGDRHTIILATQGHGTIDIGGRDFALAPQMGVYVRPGEAFAIHNAGEQTINLYVSVCPQATEPAFADDVAHYFDDAFPRRTVDFDSTLRQRMGDRSFQILVDKAVGSDLVTQFIGDIPLSKAAPHRHLYEEALIVLSGGGCMWTEDLKADVTAGDIIFLPARQTHSLQCTDAGGMVVAGVIYPGGNPNINY